MSSSTALADDFTVIRRFFDHIDNRTTDTGTVTWREPVANYTSPERLAAELALMRRHPTPFCPSAALPDLGSYVARSAAGIPLLVVRGSDGRVRAFRNACRHRGAQVAAGAGCDKAFQCRYHGWTYGTDGALLHVPHEHGFPGLDKSERGLVAVTCVERRGIVFVTQDEPALAPSPPLEALPPLIDSSYRAMRVEAVENPVEANWKVVVESFLEGYHIRSTHRETFYPLQYDNLNVIESFGNNSRVAFPYRSINKYRNAPPHEHSSDGTLTYVYHLFPNAMVATFPGRIFMVVIEPISLERSCILTYLTTAHAAGDDEAEERMTSASQLVDAGGAEDRAMTEAIQRGMATGANQFFEYGLFESAIAHFHRTLGAALGEARGQ